MPRKKVAPQDRKKGEYYEYKREKQRISDKAEWVIAKHDKEFNRLTSRLADKLRITFRKICKDVVNEWYADYIPNKYNRKHSLRKFPYIESEYDANKQQLNLSWGFNDTLERQRHLHRVDRVNPEYVFVNSFLHGWHGGADLLGSSPAPGYETPPHPQPRNGPFGKDNESGVPYWRFPYARPPKESGIKRWEYWSERPAARSFSPRDRIMELWIPKKKELQEQYLEDVKKMQDELFDILYKYIEKNKRW